ncbi:hypothetical protein LT493_14060 [Streptomyces tricolor]|nr:hypothetical protein [Streptomyces tricolor]
MPTFAAFAEPGIDQVCFPVDAVYTWVDGGRPGDGREAPCPPGALRQRHRPARDRRLPLHQPRRAEVRAAVAGDVRRFRPARLPRDRLPRHPPGWTRTRRG